MVYVSNCRVPRIAGHAVLAGIALGDVRDRSAIPQTNDLPERLETMAIDTSKWSAEDLIKEAGMQTAAIQKIKVWLRLAYSACAIGFLLGWWGFYGNGPAPAGIGGIVLLVLGVLLAVPLKIGVTNATRNVEHILAAAEAKKPC